MDVKKVFEKITDSIKKYRYAILVLAIGLVLMVLPSEEQYNETSPSVQPTETIIDETLEDKLIAILSQVEGAGEVQVILTVAAGKETIYQTNETQNASSDSNSSNINTVTITDADRNQAGLIRQENPATYQGAVVVCQGADNPSVKLALIEAVSKLTGLGSNCIAVLKMK